MDEYLVSKNLGELNETIIEVVENEKLERCIGVGHFILWGFSKTPKDFSDVCKMIQSLHDGKYIAPIDVEEG